MKPQVHKFPFQVKERPVAVNGQGWGQFDNAGDHQRSDFPGAAGHGQNSPGQDPRQRAGNHDFLQGLPFGRAQRQ